MRKPHEWLLDASIYFSFDRSGYARHARTWPGFSDPLLTGGEQPLVGLITGGSRGIGAAAVERLRTLGHQVITCGRSPGQGQRDYLSLDTSDWAAGQQAVRELPSLDFVGLNAGAMPDRFTRNADGVELQMASQLFGHFLLVRNLLRTGRLRPGARILWMSSGGMYLQRLHLRHLLENQDYDKVATYANVKRAQVVLNEEMARMPEFNGVGCYAMHPGWVDTAGLRAAIPTFWRWTHQRLRTPEQGADTLVWLAARPSEASARVASPRLVSGALYFDRRRVSPCLVPGTRASAVQRKRLLAQIEHFLAPYTEPPGLSGEQAAVG